MIQCRQCHRYAPGDLDCCPFCQNQGIAPFIPLPDRKYRDDHEAYRVYISQLEIAGAAYRIAAPLARGGCGVILKVEAADGGEACALKVPFIFDEMFTNRQGNSAAAMRKSEKALWEEIHAFDRLESPFTLKCLYRGNITANYNGRSATFPAILMELALASLEHLVRNHACGENPIPLEEKIKIIDHLLESVHYLHKNRLVHRDISPANIFAVKRGSHIRYIVSDYGSSRHGDDIDSTRFSSSILANYLYLDPQRLQDPSFAYDPRSDIYSVGIVMAEVFAGNFWHAIAGFPKGDGVPVNFRREVLDPHLDGLLDRRLLKIVGGATAFKPRRRYPSISALKSNWDRYARSLKTNSETSASSRIKQTAEPLILAILAALLTVTLRPAIQFFTSPSPALSRPSFLSISTYTPDIIRLVISGDRAQLESLLKYRGYTDHYGPNGWTPLHWAMYLKRFKIALLLMDHGASWNAPSKRRMFDIPAGETPRQLFIHCHPRLESEKNEKRY